MVIGFIGLLGWGDAGRQARYTRWAARVERPDGPDGCWLWTGHLTGGYGLVGIGGGKKRGIHRVVYEDFVGPVPDGLELDHLCRVRHCCNPAHLEPVTHRENGLRGESFAAENARKTHCPQGHAYDESNAGRINGRRYCRACIRERSRERRIAERAGLIPVGVCPRCQKASRLPGRSYCSPCGVAQNGRKAR